MSLYSGYQHHLFCPTEEGCPGQTPPWAFCRGVTVCCNGYWHVSSEEPGHQLTAAKLARTISTPGWCRVCNEQQGSGHRGYVTSGDMETRIDVDRRGRELETIYMYDWVQRCGGLATTLQSHTERELELCSPVRLHIGCSLQ